MSSKKEKVPILSFYSGGGFLDMGFEMAGFEIVWTNEVDEMFAKLHSAGISSWRKSRGNGVRAEILNTKSILEISSNDIISEAFQGSKPAHFGIIGGPPCQDFSTNGSFKGFSGERGKLTIVFFDKIMELQPTFFVMENVTGLIKGASTREYLKKLLKRVEKDYLVDHKTLNSLNFGVPQSRERVFFVGIRRDQVESIKYETDISGSWFNWPVDEKYVNSEGRYTWPKMTDFGKRLTKPEKIPLELCVMSCLVNKNEMDSIANSTEFFNLYMPERKLSLIKEGETNRPSFKRLHRFKYSPTTCYGNNEVHLHPFKNRRLSVREVLRIQGVPDSYVLPPELSLTKKFKMIGNGVPVPLGKAVATALMRFVKTYKII